MTPTLRRGAILSAALHVAVIATLIVGFHAAKQPELPPETGIAMVFDGAAKPSVQAPQPAPVPAPAAAPAEAPAPPVTEPSKQQPIEAVPPPPPPPPPSPAQQVPARPAAAPLPPTTALAPPAPPSPSPPKEALPNPPQQQAMPLPLPPPPAPPPPNPASTTSQPNPTKNPVPNSRELENTLEKLRQIARQKEPPRARYNPHGGGAPNGSSNPLGNDTAVLTADQRGTIGDHVRECWTYDPGALGVDKMRVMLQVTTDSAGIARDAEIAGADQSRMGDPVFRAFAERARRAVLDQHCANLPLPKRMLGKNNVLTFRFSP
ncbi:MAG: hypothetical protein JO227_12855 [Acetobacteraceae bacterium]|nr:hypothetical protein [Acetobacteraceae bacterium]